MIPRRVLVRTNSRPKLQVSIIDDYQTEIHIISYYSYESRNNYAACKENLVHQTNCNNEHAVISPDLEVIQLWRMQQWCIHDLKWDSILYHPEERPWKNSGPVHLNRMNIVHVPAAAARTRNIQNRTIKWIIADLVQIDIQYARTPSNDETILLMLKTLSILIRL